ncbi:hypothetical protein EAX62_12270 [Tessaracoccus antarcticus]|uniref:Uncharacterized protein n=1 Tax=Tessaracoccus antarcticus TaxID=2479848 RepID=A0A3M0G8Y7_9ACTN|nr:hypothetical protein EAX62_12270 [Tessaracoccus antarcticus]
MVWLIQSVGPADAPALNSSPFPPVRSPARTSSSYVAGWAGGDIEMIQGSAANVLRAVHQLAGALIEDDTPAAEAA